jgi:HK97 family phage prohead protease
MKDIEKRSINVELRVVGDGDKRKLVGTPIVYNKDSEDMGFIERIKPGAATEALKTSDVRLLYGHNSSSLLPLGRTSAGTLRAVETKKGIDIEADPPDTQFARDLITAIERGDVQDMSFGFTVADDIWETIDGKDVRTITKFRELYDFSYVAFPAYSDTTVAIRERDKHRNAATGDEIEEENTNIEIDLLLSGVRRI